MHPRALFTGVVRPHPDLHVKLTRRKRKLNCPKAGPNVVKLEGMFCQFEIMFGSEPLA
jgi:hypothetical protein